MRTKSRTGSNLTKKINTLLAKQPGLSVKDIAGRLDTNRQFMAGVLAVLEERHEVTCRRVGPARIYFVAPVTGRMQHE